MTAVETAPARTRRRVLPWVAGAVFLLLIVAWIMVGKNPSLDLAGTSWQSEGYVPANQAADDFKEPTSWVAWDQPDGAWASVTMRNTRPYPVTISAADNGPVVEIALAPHDPLLGVMDVMGPLEAAVGRVSLAPCGQAIVAMHLTEQCVEITAGSTIGQDSVTLNVTSFGISASLEVGFPATYMAGCTRSHGPDPSCSVE